MIINKTIRGLLAALMGIVPAVPAFAGPGGGNWVQADKYANVPYANLEYAQRHLVPVYDGGYFAGDGGLATANNQSRGRKVVYCPRGASSIRLILSGTYYNPAETDNTTGMPIDIGIETNVAPPWQMTTTYTAGQTVSYGVQQWTATATSTGSVPNATNGNWTANAVPASQMIPVTCNGSLACAITTTTTSNAAASTVATGMVRTDTMAINIPVGSYIAIDYWINQVTVTGSPALGEPSNPLAGEAAVTYTSLGDTTQSGAFPTAPTNMSSMWSPAAILGTPLVDGPTVCIIGDSISGGIAGSGAVSFGTLTGGSGFVAEDIGKLMVISNTGASAGAVNASAMFEIGAVTSGAISSLALVSSGSYTSPSAQTSQTLPSGVQTLSMAPGYTSSGTGASIASASIVFASARAAWDIYNGMGYIQRGLDAVGIPWVAFSRAGNTLQNWITRSYTKEAIIHESGCSSAIVELGVNDLTNGSAGMITNAQLLANALRGAGVQAVFWTTITPNVTTSTDGFLTPNNQTPNSSNAARITFNNTIRSLPSWLNGYFEISDLAETSRGSGIFITNGSTVCLFTCDGTHPTTYGHNVLSQGIINGSVQLQ